MLILASASPRRHELLVAAGIDHIVQPSDVVEIRSPHEEPRQYARRLAQAKAHAVPAGENDVVLGADTIVCLGDVVFGKPQSNEEAATMLRSLSGRLHQVYTGICLRAPTRSIVDIAETRVSFIGLTESEIEAYVSTGEPMGKAGAYAIQGLASRFVTRIEGCYHNVVGLPVSLVYRHLKAI